MAVKIPILILFCFCLYTLLTEKPFILRSVSVAAASCFDYTEMVLVRVHLTRFKVVLDRFSSF